MYCNTIGLLLGSVRLRLALPKRAEIEEIELPSYGAGSLGACGRGGDGSGEAAYQI